GGVREEGQDGEEVALARWRPVYGRASSVRSSSIPVNQTFRSVSSTSSIRPAETVSSRTQTDTALKPISRRAGAYVSRSRLVARGEALPTRTDRVTIRSQGPAGRSSTLKPPVVSKIGRASCREAQLM